MLYAVGMGVVIGVIGVALLGIYQWYNDAPPREPSDH